MKKLLCIITAALLLVCCSDHDKFGPGQVSTVNFVYNGPLGKTLSVNDAFISNCNIMVYDAEGSLVASQYEADGPVTRLSMRYTPSAGYRFYCVCNIGDISTDARFARESGLKNYQYTVSAYDGIINEFGAVPMSGCTPLLTISDGMSICIDLTRCVALVTIRIDKSALENSSIDIQSVALKNSPTKVGLFGSSAASSAAECVQDSDSASSSELATFNSGDPVGFYLFENKQGVLLPDNTTCSGKVFSAGSVYESICSYVELSGQYNDPLSDNPRHGDFTYRFYLGENNTTDFSVVRNHHYHIVLMLSDEGVDEVSWRVDSELVPYATAVIVDPPQYTFPRPSGSYTLTATVLPSSVSQQVSWSSSNPAVASVDSDGTVSAHSPGQAIIKATATDGSGVFGTSTITVLEPSRPISIRPNYLSESEWVLGTSSSVDDFCVTVTYENGGTLTLSGSEALATIDNIDGEWIIADGALTAPAYGTALELLLKWQDPASGETVTFSSEGEVIAPQDIFTVSGIDRLAKKYGDSGDTPIAAGITCYSSPLVDLSGRIVFSTGNANLTASADAVHLKGESTLNGQLSYWLRGEFDDDFNNPVSKTVNLTTMVYEWSQHYYEVEINTMVREHIDASFSSQVQPDNIKVTIRIIRSSGDNTLVAEYFYPASYDSNGDLAQGGFSYSWYTKNLYVQMQDIRSFSFDFDNEGNLLPSGWCTEGARYIYYE